MTNHLADVLIVAYVLDMFLLLALADRLDTIRPVSRAFVLLSMVAAAGLVIGNGNTSIHSYTRYALHAAVPAASTWAVLESCKPNSTRTPWFAFAAALTWLVGTRLPTDETLVSFFGTNVPEWQRTAAIYWCAVWSGWTVVALVGWWRLLVAPIRVAHVLAGLTAVSVGTEAAGMLAWAGLPRGYNVVLGFDVLLAMLVGIIAGVSLWKTAPA